MTKTRRARQDPVEQARAVEALRASGCQSEVVAIETLQLSKKSKVHRLSLDDDGGTVIVKLGKASYVSVDCEMFRILPSFGLRAPAVHAVMPSEDPERSWMILEDCGDSHPDLSRADHLEAITRFVGTLHVEGSRHSGLQLPPRGPSYYAALARAASFRLQATLAKPSHQPLVDASRRALVGLCADAATALSEADALAEELPSTVVHGDFQPKNLLLLPASDRFDVVCLDWETVGYGFPGRDLPRAMPDVYWRQVCSGWAYVSQRTVYRQLMLGRVARDVQAISWELESFDADYLGAESGQNLVIYQSRLASALPELLAELALP